MARLARVEVFAADEVAIVHLVNRTERRCFLVGDDPLTQKNYDHRKAWMERELEHLARFFSIDLLCFAILSNHFHLVLRSRPDVVAQWDDREVARRWLMPYGWPPRERQGLFADECCKLSRVVGLDRTRVANRPTQRNASKCSTDLRTAWDRCQYMV